MIIEMIYGTELYQLQTSCLAGWDTKFITDNEGDV
jgi:hypothetical protein